MSDPIFSGNASPCPGCGRKDWIEVPAGSGAIRKCVCRELWRVDIEPRSGEEVVTRFGKFGGRK